MKNHGVSCMSMGFLLGNNVAKEGEEEEERVVAWERNDGHESHPAAVV